MASPVAFDPAASLEDIYKASLGFQNWNFDPFLSGANTAALTSQTIFAAALPLRAGQEVTNVVLHVATAAVGTNPTGLYVGLGTDKQMLAISANLAADTGFTSTGLKQFALAQTTFNLLIPESRLYYAYMLMNGTFGTTQPLFGRGGTSSNQLGITGGALPCATAGTGQTVLPAVGAAITLSSSSALNFWAGLS